MAPFDLEYGFLHRDDLTFYGLYIAKDWEPLRLHAGVSGHGEFFAKKSYTPTISAAPGTTLSEETWFFLKHTPDAPMPECP
jgi:hypothetical protein